MKLSKILAILFAASSTLLGTTLLADTTNTPVTPTPPVVVPTKPDFSKLPPEVKAMIKDFEAARDNYQAKQAALIAKLKGATPAQREAIRDQLQVNRQAFLDEVQAYRIEIRKELKDTHDAALDRWRASHTGELPGKHHKGGK